LNISVAQTIEHLKAALTKFFGAGEGSLDKDVDHSEVVQYLHNYKILDQGGIEKNLVDNVTIKLTAIKDFDFTGIDKIVDNIPVPVLKPELPPKNHFVIGKVSFKDSANNDIASPNVAMVRLNPQPEPSSYTKLQSGTTYSTQITVNGTDYVISFDGADAETFVELETKLQAEINAVVSGVSVKVHKNVFLYSNDTITIDESAFTNKLFASLDGYKDIVTKSAQTEMVDTQIDADEAFVGIGVLNYKTGKLILVNGTWLPDNVVVRYLQDDRMNFKVSPTQVLDIDLNRSTFTDVG